jgi:alkylation response protein AidB-like acyl-CoA dehydrogenase
VSCVRAIPTPLAGRHRLELAFDLTREQCAFQAELRGWLSQHVPRDPEPGDERERFAFRRAWQATLHRHGWAGIAWPVAYGGRGAGPIEQFLYYEELAWAGAPEFADTPGLLIVGPTLMLHGTGAQKTRFLPKILGAEEIWCQGFSESGAGSDLTALKCRARRSGDQWLVDGEKIWTTLGPYADFNALLVRTAEPDDGRRHTGLSMLIVAHDQPAVSVTPLKQLNGDSEFAQLFFTGARTPADWVIGKPGDGWPVALTMLDCERSDQGFTDHGRLFAMIGQIRRLVASAEQRGTLSGDALADTRHRLVDLYTRCQLLCEWNLGRALALQRGERIGSWGSFLKLYWSELWQATAELGLDLAGPDSPADRDWLREYLLSLAATIYSGSSEVQRNTLGERILGLPR